MRKFFGITSRVAMASLGGLLIGFMGWGVAAMLHVSFPIAEAIATSATVSQPIFLAWMSTGMLGLGCCAFAAR